MKKCIVISLGCGLLAIILCITGCSTIKRHIKSVEITVKSDSVTAKVNVTLAKKDSSSHTRDSKDTVIGVPAAAVKVTTPAGWQGDTTVRSGHSKLHTYTDAAGRTTNDCSCDSLTIAFTNVIRERDYYRGYADSSYVEGQRSVSSEAVVSVKEIERVKEVIPWWLWALLAAAIVVGVFRNRIKLPFIG